MTQRNAGALRSAIVQINHGYLTLPAARVLGLTEDQWTALMALPSETMVAKVRPLVAGAEYMLTGRREVQA